MIQSPKTSQVDPLALPRPCDVVSAVGGARDDCSERTPLSGESAPLLSDLSTMLSRSIGDQILV